MTKLYLPGVAIVLCLGALSTCLLFPANQDVPAAPDAGDDYESSLRIKLSAQEVLLDVAVLDKKSGKPVTDLTADDFEVFQDDKRQQIKSSVYIDSQPNADAQPDSAKGGLNHPPSPATSPKREDVHRTILFVVDDYAMTLENGYHTKMALGNFVEKQMRPGDMVAIFHTGYGNSVLNRFQFDKREVMARVNTMRPTTAPRPYDKVSNPYGAHEGLWKNFMVASHENRKAAISQGIRALKDMPGRKMLILATPLSVHDDPSLVPDNFTEHTGNNNTDRFPTQKLPSMFSLNNRIRRYEELYHELADEALRAGVVVNILDADGLNNYFANAQIWEGSSVDAEDPIARSSSGVWQFSSNNMTNRFFDPIRLTNPLPAQTGGLIIQDNNFFHDGIGKEAENLMKGYYLVSYEPPPDTFETHGKKEAFRRLKVSVRRKGVEVHTRSGFFGRQDDAADGDAHGRDPLVDALFSPFRHADLEVNMLSGYMRGAESGYLIRSWIHVDPKNVNVVETADGGARIDLETVCLTSDINGYVHDTKQVTHTYEIGREHRDETVAGIRRHGIRFAMLLPVKKPGAYYVRSAVKDMGSGHVGSAYQFIEIPDLAKKGTELSDVFVVDGAEDLKWLMSDGAEGGGDGLFSPVFQAEETRSPALRTYSRGDRLNALAMLYNAGDKAATDSGIEVQYILYRDGGEFRRFTPVQVKPSDAGNASGIPILQRFTLGGDIPPGEYMLQLEAAALRNGKKQKGGATQALRSLSFRVVDR
ncbi:MAG: VWA domain-containing protein [Acidobacteriota bacterium]|jgi:VWFA-related protein|nr:VWA domain-containing protein [Acidobacteriota bacterium]